MQAGDIAAEMCRRVAEGTHQSAIAVSSEPTSYLTDTYRRQPVSFQDGVEHLQSEIAGDATASGGPLGGGSPSVRAGWYMYVVFGRNVQTTPQRIRLRFLICYRLSSTCI